MKSTKLCGLLALLIGTGVAAQGPIGGKPNGPGYYGSMPSDAGKAALEELLGRESSATEELLGPGPWQITAFRNPIPYCPGPCEKNVHRLGDLTVKGPHVLFESPFCAWQLPTETDGDVAFVHRLVTGEDLEGMADIARSARLASALRVMRAYGAIVRGLRATGVTASEALVDGGPARASIIVYNASGKALDLYGSATLHIGSAVANVDVDAWSKDPRHFVLEPGQSVQRDLDLTALAWRDAEGKDLTWRDVTPVGPATLHLEIALDADDRGARGVVRSGDHAFEIGPAPAPERARR